MYCRYIIGAKKKLKIKKKKMTYASAFESAGIDIAYASTFESAGTGLLNFIHS